jgi:hypothetical protein
MSTAVEWTNRPDLPAIQIDRDLRFIHPAIQQAHAYWQTLRGDQSMPSRDAIDPVEMREFLPYVGLVEAAAGSGGRMNYAIRLAGSHVEEVLTQISGRSLSQFLEPDIEERWRYVFDLALAEAAPVRLAGRVAFQRRTWLDSETLLAPLADRQHGTTMLFGAFAAWPSDREPSGRARLVAG